MHGVKENLLDGVVGAAEDFFIGVAKVKRYH